MKKLLLFFGLAILCLTFASSCEKQKLQEAERSLVMKSQQIEQLETQVEHLQETNNSLLDRLSDLSVISKTGAESIKESLQSINQQYSFIQDLTTKIQHKDSLNLALVMNIKRSLRDVNDDDIQVEVKGGFVNVSISDKLLFQSGSAKINPEARDILEKLALILNDHYEMNILVEGHTDNVPIANGCTADNWDLSVKRATSVVRLLQQEFFVDPERMTAAGRSEFIPKASNDDSYGRSQNRRTEIIIMPKLDQFFELLEQPELLN